MLAGCIIKDPRAAGGVSIRHTGAPWPHLRIELVPSGAQHSRGSLPLHGAPGTQGANLTPIPPGVDRTRFRNRLVLIRTISPSSRPTTGKAKSNLPKAVGKAKPGAMKEEDKEVQMTGADDSDNLGSLTF